MITKSLVYLALDRLELLASENNKHNDCIRAVKMIEKSKLSKQSLIELAKEIEIWKDLDHPNIVKIYESYEDIKYLYIVSELITGGELLQEIFRRK